MAALLCQSLCTLCSDCTGCISYPCQKCCSAASKMLCSPFTPYLSLTIAFNVPLVLWGWKTIENKAAFCEKAWWLWLNAVMAMIHIIGSCYIVYRIQEEKEPIEEDAFLYYHNDVEDDVNGYPPHQQQNSNAPAQTVQIIGLAPDDDDVSALGVGGATTTNPVQTKNKDGNTSDDSNDSKEPLRVVVEVPANNHHRSACLSPRGGGSRAVGSPRSLSSPRSVSSKNSSPFRTIFSNTRNTIDAQRRAPDTIESVASLVAGLPDDTKNDRANSLPRIGKVLCYDPGTAVYFFVAILWVTWQTVGVGFAVSLARNNDAYVYQCADIKEWVVLSTICGFLYMMLGLFAFGCSLLCLR